MSIKLLPKQADIFLMPEGIHVDTALYQGGFGAGKTWLGAVIGLVELEKHKAMRQPKWLVGADTGTRLKLSTWSTYLELLYESGIKYDANKSDRIIEIPAWNHAQIIFKGLDDPFSLRSINAIGGHLEEASLISEVAYNEFRGRLRQGGMDSPIRLVLTTNPQMQKGWLFDRFVTHGGVKEEWVSLPENQKVLIRVAYRRIVARTMDNPYLSPAFVASLKSAYDEESYRILVLGEDGDYTKGLVCKTWTFANVDDVTYDPSARLYLSCDFNIDPNCWIVAHRRNDEYHFIDELCLENTSTVQATEEFYNRYQGHKGDIIITGDASGNNRGALAQRATDTNYTLIQNRLDQLGMPNVSIDTRNANPAIIDRVEAWNALTCNSVGIRRIKVHSKCKWLIQNCENLRYLEGSSVIYEPSYRDVKNDPKLKFTKHIWDAASYLVERYNPIERDSLYRKPAGFRTLTYMPTR